MTGDEVRQVCEAMLPQGEIDCLCAPFGVIERQRQLKLGMFVRAMVISAGTPGGAYQADVLRSYLELGPPESVRLLSVFAAPLERFRRPADPGLPTPDRRRSIPVLGWVQTGTSSMPRRGRSAGRSR